MEASAAQGPAAPGAGDGGEAQQQGQEQQQGGEQPDFAAIQQQLADLGPSLEQMRGMLSEQQEQQAAWAEQQQGYEGDPSQEQQQQPEPDLSFMDPDSPQYNPQQTAMALAQLMEQQSQQQVQAAVEPLQEQIATMEAQRQADLLAGEFPEMQDPEIAQNVIDVSRQYAQMLGQPELGDNPQFWRMAYMAGRAADAANAEQQQQPAAATLEGAGGASPGAADQREQLVQGILNADGAGRSVLPF